MVTGRINVIAPATMTVVNGGTVVSSLQTLPPYGITVTDPETADTLSVTLVAANAGATLAAAAPGVSVVANGNTLALTGTAAAINAALAGLSLQEPANAMADLISLTASDPQVLTYRTDIAVRITPVSAPAFAAPPATLAVQPNALTTLHGLVLGDPAAAALAASGQGRGQTLEITLNVGAGILLLPGLVPGSGVTVAGQGSNSLSLIFTADQLGTVNAALAGLIYAGPGGTRLSYAMTDLSGPLGPAVTDGSITLTASGTAGANGTFAAGAATVILGGGTGALSVNSLTADTGAFGGSVFIGAGGTLEMPASALSLSGTSDDFGSLAAGSLNVTGNAWLANGADIGGEISLGAGGLLDFGGTLFAGATLTTAAQTVLTLAANAVLTGSGTLQAADANGTGTIAGPGTLLAGGGDTLSVAASDISGAALQVGGGGVLELGAGMTVSTSVTLGFASAYGVAPAGGGFADSLAQNGGVIVIGDPLSFLGSISGFAPGDRLVLPGLSSLSVSNVTSQSFVVTGTSAGHAEQFTLHAALPAGATLELGTDAAGDAEISLKPAGPEIFIGGHSFSSGQIDASAGVGQSLLGLAVLAPGSSAQSLSLTLAVGDGKLSYGTVTPAATLQLNAANPTALNALLSELVYTASLAAAGDTLTASSNTGVLAGLSSSVVIDIETAGTIAGFAQAPTGEQTVLFAGSTAAAPQTAAAAPGAVIVSEAVDFADLLAVGGIGGTAFSVDDGGSAYFDGGSVVTLTANAVIGDSGGAGTLGIATDHFTIGSTAQNAGLVVGGNTAAAGSAVEITGALQVDGEIFVGQSAASRLEVSGILDATQTTIAAAGTLAASGNAAAAFGDLADAGTLQLENDAQATAQQLVLSGQLTLGGGTTLSGLSSAVIANGGSLVIGTDAALSASGLNALGGSVLDQGSLLVAGNLLSDAAITLAGGLLDAAAITLGSGATLSGYGNVVAAAANAKIALTGGEILASSAHPLGLDGDVTMSNGGSIVIGASAALDLIQGAAGGTIVFAGAESQLTVNDLALDSSAVAGMTASDVIDLIGVAPSLVTYSGGLVSATDASGNPLGSFGLGLAGSQPAVTIVSDNEGGALITLGGEMACFARGTRLLTPNGYVPVEAFKPGDPIITRLGARRAVRWIGRRRLAIDPRDRHDLRPVLIQPGAFGPMQPSRPVRLSPSHAVFFEGVLVPIRHLVNGATILREARGGAVTYFHIELDRHEVLMAEGLPVESYIDTGNRGEFHQELGLRGNAVKSCAPFVIGGPQLSRIRRRLHALTLQAGFTLARAPSLEARIGEARLLPEMRMNGRIRVARFHLPPGADCINLLAPTAAPAETDPESDDRRELALCLRPPRAKGRRLRLGAGWHPKARGDAGIWMSGCAEIFLPPDARQLTLNLLATVQGWEQKAGSSRQSHAGG
jgi:hypothetical protein